MFDKSIGMFVYEYTHIDDLSFISRTDGDFKINQFTIKEIFKKHGWEGDGKIGKIWLPPFLFDDGNTDGIYLWHVKQKNNGVSYIISPCEIPFGYLGSQNLSGETFFALTKYIDKNMKELKKWLDEIVDQQKYLNIIPRHHEKEKLTQRAFASIHDDIIYNFKTWIDTYFLFLLQEKVLYKNYKIKIPLQKMKVTYMRSNDEINNLSQHQKDWLFQADVISSAWNSYKEFGMKEKFDLIFKAVGFKQDEVINFIKAHIELRNCIHHNGGIVSKETLDRLGVCELKLPSGEVFAKGDQVKLTVDSIGYFIDILMEFVNNYRTFLRKYFFYKQ